MTAIEVQQMLGQAAFARWSELPRDVQELLFESAAPPDGPVRTEMAVVLHDHHPRTAHPPRPPHLA